MAFFAASLPSLPLQTAAWQQVSKLWPFHKRPNNTWSVKTSEPNTGSSHTILVGGFKHLEKYESMGRMTSRILWKIKAMFETTNQYLFKT
jgi:hypothetical protein